MSDNIEVLTDNLKLKIR